MKELPLELRQIYHLALKHSQKNQDQTRYKKYFCYFWNYCQTYQLELTNPSSQLKLLAMLDSKGVRPEQINLVSQAVFFYTYYLKWQEVYQEITRLIKLRHYSPRTLKVYLSWARKLAQYTGKMPEQLSKHDVENYLSYLAVERALSASSQNQAFHALSFFYSHVLKLEMVGLTQVVKAKRKPYIPVVLSKEEVKLIFAHLKPPYYLIVQLLYGCGLRLSECLSLRVQDLI